MPKTIHDQFLDWHNDAFPCGYGTGDPHTLGALRSFLLACESDGRYQYTVAEAACGQVVAWLLINTLCGLDLIDYGTSPRFGWLTAEGIRLRDYFATTDLDEIIAVATGDGGEPQCFPDLCQCKAPCMNPFWPHNASRSAKG